MSVILFFNDTATTQIYTYGHPLSLHDALPICRIEWTGNRGEGTRSYRGYDRSWSVTTPGQPVIHCSNDPRLGGDPGLPNPEDMLLSALAACHMLWYLHLASAAGIVVQSYQDTPIGRSEEHTSELQSLMRISYAVF